MIVRLSAYCCFFLFFLCNTSYGQSSSVPFYYRIGEEDFSNVNVYSLLFDENDEVLYAATNTGVYYYTQSKFHHIKADTLARGNSYFSLQQNSKGDIFCMNLQGQIFEVSRKELRHCLDYPKEHLKGDFRYLINQDDNIVCLGNKLIEYRSSGSKFKGTVLLENTAAVVNIIQLKSGKYLLGRYSSFSKERHPIKYLNNEALFIDVMGSNVMELSGKLNAVAIKLDKKEIGLLYEYNASGQKVRTVPMEGGNQFYRQISDSSFVILNRKNGMNICVYDGRDYLLSKKLFNSEFISVAFQAKNGAIFLGTFKEGVLVVPNLSYLGYESNFLHSSIKNYDSTYSVVANRNGQVYGYAKNGSGAQLIYQSNRNQDGIIVSPEINKSSDQWWKLAKVKNLSTTGAIDLGRGDVAMLSWNGIIALSFNEEISNYKGYKKKNRTNEVYVRRDGRYNALAANKKERIIYASKLGDLYRCDYLGENYRRVGKDIPMSVWSLHFADGRLYCGTETRGIFVFENDKLVDRIDQHIGLFDSQIRKIQKKGHFLYILTPLGLQIFNMEKRAFVPFGIATNLLDQKLIDFDITENNLLVLRKKDHFSVPLNSLSEPVGPSAIYIDSFLVNGTKANFEKNQFSYLQNSMVFFVDYRDFLTKKKTIIEYKLEGFYDEWRTLKPGEHRIEFQSLPVGKYTFRVRAKFEGQSSEEFQYAFEIAPPFWQTWWFYTFMVILIVLIIGGIAILQVRRIRIKAKQRVEVESTKALVLNAQLKAIRAQMNPHFVFNSINSIQDLVLQKQTLKSYDYLESFSRLVRMTLDHSESEFVQLEEELEFLHLYLDLESLRFKKDFEYTIQLPDELKRSKVPSLIIQPFVENAIKHGLLHRQGKKHLSIEFFSVAQQQIQCVITDNGVGRQRSQEISARRGTNHRSFSTGAIDMRIQMLNDQFKGTYSYNIQDLYNSSGYPNGTKVLLQFPSNHRDHEKV